MKHLTLAILLTVVALSTPVFAQDSGSGGDQSQSSSGQKKHHHHKKQQSQSGQSQSGQPGQ